MGIDRMGVAFPGWRVSCRELAEARGVVPDKVVLGLGMESFGVPMPWQDTVTLAADALDDLVVQGVDLRTLGRIVVATESALDGAKPVAAWLHGMFGLSDECEAFDVKFACVGGVYALMDALRFVDVTGIPAAVVATDIAVYGPDGSAECTQGAGAVALLVTREPGFLVVDPNRTGTFTRDEDDFHRPFGSMAAVVRGRQSVECYLRALAAVSRYRKRFCADERLWRAIDRIVFHTPYPGLPRKALAHLLAEEPADAATADRLREGVEWSVGPARRLGNTYTASVFLALASLATHVVRGQVGVYTYGSGSGSRFFVGELPGNAAAVEHVARRLTAAASGAMLTVSEMESAFYRHEVPPRVEAGPGWFVAGEDGAGYRRYARRARSA